MQKNIVTPNKMRSRILFVSHTADWTGPTSSLMLLLERLHERYDLAVLLPGWGGFSDALVDKKIIFHSFSSMDKFEIPAMTRLIKRERIDLVYGNGRNGISRNAMIASKFARVPFICHVREMEWGDSWRISGFLAFSDATIAVSKACAIAISRFVPPRKLHVVYNGISLSNEPTPVSSARSNFRKELGLSIEDLIIINSGRFIPAKGQEYAVQAMVQIVKSIPTARLIFVGSFDSNSEERLYAERVREIVEDLNLHKHVFILGFRNDVRDLMAGADMFLHTSIKDAHPRSVIEAMDTGLPVVAFAVDGVVETVLDGETGYLVDQGDVAGMGDAVVRLLANPDLCRQMGMQARQRVQTHFSVDQTAEQVDAVINRVLAGKKERAKN